MNGMIRYKTTDFPSRKLPYRHLYTIKTRDTIYGIHKENKDLISKTSLVLFIEKKHANMFKDHIEMNQKNKKFYNRITSVNNELYISTPVHLSSFMPLQVYKEKASELELLSIMNYFDILIVSKTEYSSSECLYVYGFDYIIDELPNRKLIEYQLKYDFNQYDK